MLSNIVSENSSILFNRESLSFKLSHEALVKNGSDFYKTTCSMVVFTPNELLKRYHKIKGTIEAINQCFYFLENKEDLEVNDVLTSGFDRNKIPSFDSDFYFDIKYRPYENDVRLQMLKNKLSTSIAEKKELEETQEELDKMKAKKEFLIKDNSLSINVSILNGKDTWSDIINEKIEKNEELLIKMSFKEDIALSEKLIADSFMPILKGVFKETMSKKLKAFRPVAF